MSRVIKFRAWCWIPCFKLIKTDWEGKYLMCVVSMLNTNKKTIRVNFARHNGQKTSENLNIEDVELMQFTGLKDSKGVEIYEGDILKHKYNEGIIGTVVFGEFSIGNDDYSIEYIPVCFAIEYIDSSGYAILNKSGDGYGYGDGATTIIGNKYEHPNLLNSK